MARSLGLWSQHGSPYGKNVTAGRFIADLTFILQGVSPWCQKNSFGVKLKDIWCLISPPPHPPAGTICYDSETFVK